jgi:hypothetical protein
MDISTPEELKDKVVETIDSDLRSWVESEGAYSFIVGKKIRETSRQNYEDLIQKTILTQLNYALIKNGFNDVDVVRENQLLDNKRVDFRISYGFVGPIVIEVKRSSHQDLNGDQLREKESYINLSHYMQGNEAHFGIFLVFDDKERPQSSQTWEEHFSKIKVAYETIRNVTVLGIKC